MGNFRLFVARRFAFVLFAMWLVFTGMFAFVMYAPDPNEALLSWGATIEDDGTIPAVEAYRAERGFDRPLYVQYLDWLTDYATLEWGESYEHGEPVTAVLADALLVTGVYMIPAVVVSTIGGVLVGSYSSIRDGAVDEYVNRLLVYGIAAVPAFFLAAVAFDASVSYLDVLAYYDPGQGLFSRNNLLTLSVPGTVFAVTLLGAQARYVRTYAQKYAAAEFTKLVRSKGAGSRRIAAHVLRNAALPLVSTSFAELFGTFVFSIFVIETIFSIPGIGLLGYEAADKQDVALLLGTTLVIVVMGLIGNLLQDIAYAYLDPRVELE